MLCLGQESIVHSCWVNCLFVFIYVQLPAAGVYNGGESSIDGSFMLLVVSVVASDALREGSVSCSIFWLLCGGILTAPKIYWFIIFQPLRLPSIHPFYILANLVESWIPACSHSSPRYHRALHTEAAKECFNSTCTDDKFFQSALPNATVPAVWHQLPLCWISLYHFLHLTMILLGQNKKGNQKCHPPPGGGNLRFCMVAGDDSAPPTRGHWFPCWRCFWGRSSSACPLAHSTHCIERALRGKGRAGSDLMVHDQVLTDMAKSWGDVEENMLLMADGCWLQHHFGLPSKCPKREMLFLAFYCISSSFVLHCHYSNSYTTKIQGRNLH